MQRKYLDLLLIPEDAGQIRRFRIPRWPRTALIGILAFVLLFVIGAGIAYLRLLAVSHEKGVLAAENEGLRRELVALGGQINQLDGTVRSHIRLANDARLLAGLPPFGEEAALLGVGGVSAIGEVGEPGLSPPVARTVAVFRDRLDRLGNQLSFQEESFEQVKDVIESSKERLDHIPTIAPILGTYYISSGFGPRRDPFTGKPSYHNGLDMSAQRGTKFCAAADGKVIFAGKSGHLGNVIKIDHLNGFVSFYGHADQILAKRGQLVRRGDVIGTVGHTGRSTGDHLHYEIQNNKRPVNPGKYILQG